MRHNYFTALFFIIVCLFARQAGFASQLDEFARGKVIEKVICKADASLSYALYLPANYTANKKWPVIYGFDPGGRGPLPVEQFKEAAERYGYIVVGSNDSRNGPGVNLNKIVSTLWNDTHERFAIDNNRVYTTGFSGGARVASAVAYSLQGIAGVIACGAGLQQNIAPSKSLPFAFFAIIGTEDFNMPELRGLDKTLAGLGLAHRLVTFEGDHRWAPGELCVEAIEWMELQAMKSGRTPKDERLVDELLKKYLARAQGFDAAQKVYQSYLSYAALVADFRGLREVAEYETRAKQLGDSKPVKEQLNQGREEDQRQMKTVRELLALKESLQDFDNRAVAFSQLKSEITTLKKKADDKNNSSERLVARRTLAAFAVSSFEGAQALMFDKKYGAAAASLEIAALIRTESAGVYFNLARAYALSGDKKKALEALKTAVAKGFADVEAVEKNEAFATLREEAKFHKLLEGLKK